MAITFNPIITQGAVYWHTGLWECSYIFLVCLHVNCVTYLKISPAGPPPPPDNCFFLRTVKKINNCNFGNSSFLAKSLIGLEDKTRAWLENNALDIRVLPDGTHEKSLPCYYVSHLPPASWSASSALRSLRLKMSGDCLASYYKQTSPDISTLCQTEMVKRICFYIAQYPVRRTAQSVLHFTPWQTCSFRHQLDLSGKHSSHAAITCEDYIHSHFHHRP